MLKFYTALENVDRNDSFCLDKYFVFIFILFVHTVYLIDEFTARETKRCPGLTQRNKMT